MYYSCKSVVVLMCVVFGILVVVLVSKGVFVGCVCVHAIGFVCGC